MSRRLILCLLLITFLVAEAGAQTPQLRFRLRSLTGERLDSQQASGTLVLSFFFTRCPPCFEEMPALLQMMRQRGAEDRLLFINPYVPELGITDQPDTQASIRRFAQQLGLPESRLFFDELGSVTKRFARAGLFPQAQEYGTLMLFPSIVVMDPDGSVRWVLEGSAPDFLEQLSQAL